MAPHERVTVIIDGMVTPIRGVPLLSSVGSRWPGFLVEAHAVPEARDEVGLSWHKTHVGVCTVGPSEIRMSGAAGTGRFVAEAGSVFIFPKGCGHTDIHHSGGSYRFVVVEVDTGGVERLFHDKAWPINSFLTPQIFIHEPHIAALIDNMRAEVEAGCHSDSLYGEALCLALAAYLGSRYSSTRQPATAANHKFSPSQIRRLLDYIHAHVGNDFSLIGLANVAHLSPRHFCRLFRNTFGTTPHRYVVSERVDQAKQLLAARQLPIIDIAGLTGFASQSHFTEVFRRTIGVSPRRYQQLH